MAGSYINAATGMKSYLDEIDITCALNMDDKTIDREVIDARTFCGNYQVNGRRTAASAFGGFGYWGADEYEDELNARLISGATVRQIFIYGNSAGSRYYEVAGPLGKQALQASPDKLIGLAGDIPKGVSFNRGLMLNMGSVITATGTHTGREVGAIAAGDTTIAVIRCTAIDGGGSGTVEIEQSSDDGGGDAYATISGMTQAVTATGVYVLTSTAATEAWKRVNITAQAGTSITITVSCGQQITT